MPLVPMKAILDATEKYNYAQGAFNVNAVCQAKAVIEVHEMFRSAAILQGADLANAFMGGRTDFANGTLEDKKKGALNIANAVKKYAVDSPIPVALHLDHGKTLDSCVAAIQGGYTSVMIDGSSLSFEENAELTREVVKYAHERGVTVEGELGVLAGVEDHVFAANSTYTNPMDAVKFFRQTGVDALAISYGTKHGANKGKDTIIRKEIAIATKECMMHEGIEGTLVSHGSSTVPQYIVSEINALGGDIHDTFNAMQLLHQHRPAILGAVLESDAYCEAICDGRHLHPGIVRLLLKTKGLNRVVAITDSIMAAGLPDGKYHLGVNEVVVEEGDAKLASDGTRAGSTLTQNTALKNLLAWTERPLEDLLPLLTENPARLIGVFDRKGSIAEGKDADLTVLDSHLNVEAVFLRGRRFQQT
ncbi:MAG: amidohydrolase family protein [Oscillibacter sp.]|nr:amidohydrolase family protein [Oscillibacter sp.]